MDMEDYSSDDSIVKKMNKPRHRINRSHVWQHFERSNDETVVCQHCGKVLIQCKGSTSTMINHMRRKHAELSDGRPPVKSRVVWERMSGTTPMSTEKTGTTASAKQLDLLIVTDQQLDENDQSEASTSVENAGPSGGTNAVRRETSTNPKPTPSKPLLRPTPRSKLFPDHELSKPQLRPGQRSKWIAPQEEEYDEDDDNDADTDEGGGVQEEDEEEDDSPIQVMWENKERMSGIMTKLFESGKFVDVTLACQGRHMQCHRLVLGACSDYFEELLQINPSQHPIIMMRDFEFWEVEAIVDFIYRGAATVPMSKFNKFIQTARLLQIKGITQMDVEGSSEEVSKFNQMNSSRPRKSPARTKSIPVAKPKPKSQPPPKIIQKPMRVIKRKAPVQPIKEIRPVPVVALSRIKTVEPASKVIKINPPPKKHIHKAFGNVLSTENAPKSSDSTPATANKKSYQPVAPASTIPDPDPDPGTSEQDEAFERTHPTENETDGTTESFMETVELTETEEYVIEDDDGTEEYSTHTDPLDEYTLSTDSVLIKEEPSSTITIENVEGNSDPPDGSKG